MIWSGRRELNPCHELKAQVMPLYDACSISVGQGAFYQMAAGLGRALLILLGFFRQGSGPRGLRWRLLARAARGRAFGAAGLGQDRAERCARCGRVAGQQGVLGSGCWAARCLTSMKWPVLRMV